MAMFYDRTFEREPEYGTEAFATAQEELVDFLASTELTDQIAAGNITVAMIRPNLDEATIEPMTDKDAASAIENEITLLGMTAKFSVHFDAAAMEEFYGGGPKEAQQPKTPDRYGHYANRWIEFVDLMESGPTTVLLLHSPDGDAIEKWRAQVGHWDVVGRRDPETIRGRHAIDNYNNLIHGSDSPESAAREVAILRKLLTRVGTGYHFDRTITANYKRGFLGPKTLDLLGTDSPHEIRILNDWERKSNENYVTDFLLFDDEGSKHLIAKACIKTSPRETVEEWLERRQVLEVAGVDFPELFAVDGATIIEEFIPHTFREAYDKQDATGQASLRQKFLATFTAICQAGYWPNSLHDVRSRGDDVVMIDVGEDVGGIAARPLSEAEIENRAQAALKARIR